MERNCAGLLPCYELDAALRRFIDAHSAPVPIPDCTVTDVGFRWNSETQEHIPHVFVQFTPVAANSPADAKGWADRDAFAALLASPPPAQPAQAEPAEFHNPWRASLENCISGDNYLRASEYRDLIEELDELYQLRAAQADPWRDAIDEALVVAHLGVATEPYDDLNRLLEWHRSIWLDPAVSSDAQALIDRGAVEERARAAQPKPEPLTDDVLDTVSNAMKRAWQLGQTYWQQADSESYSANKKSDATHRKFMALIDETRSTIERLVLERKA